MNYCELEIRIESKNHLLEFSEISVQSLEFIRKCLLKLLDQRSTGEVTILAIFPEVVSQVLLGGCFPISSNVGTIKFPVAFDDNLCSSLDDAFNTLLFLSTYKEK